MLRCDGIAARFYPRVKGNLPLAIEVAGELHGHSVFEVAVVDDDILSRMKGCLTPEHLDAFDKWVGTLNNWANTDSLCALASYT